MKKQKKQLPKVVQIICIAVIILAVISLVKSCGGEKSKADFVLDGKNLGEYGHQVVFGKGTNLEHEDVIYKIPSGKYEVKNIDSKNDIVVSVFTDAIINDETLGDDYYGVSADSKGIEPNKTNIISVHDDEHVGVGSMLKLDDFKGVEFRRLGDAEDSHMIYNKEQKPVKDIMDLKINK